MNYNIYHEDILFTLTTNELMKWLFDGKLQPFTQIQKSTQQNWQNLKDTPEGQLFYNSDKNKTWIILQKNAQKQIIQKGPYNTNQIHKFLELGLCFSWDFIGTKTFKNWKRISVVPHFLTHPAHTIEEILYQQNKLYKVPQKSQSIKYDPSKGAIKWSKLYNIIKLSKP